MEIRKEKECGLVQELIIEITKEDYEKKVEQALKKQRREAQIPGFRVGFVPMGLIKKMYEKQLIVEEVNKKAGEALYGYMQDNDIEIILEPIPLEEKTIIDFNNPDKFTFAFECALQPKFDLNLSELPEITNFHITASPKSVEEYIGKLRKKYGQFLNLEFVGEEDYLSIKYNEEETKSGFFFMNELNETGKTAFIGKKVDDIITVSLKEIFTEPAAIAKFLKIEEAEVEAENSYTKDLTISRISRMEDAELNEQFFQKLYPDGSVNSEEELKQAVAVAIEAELQRESDRYFMDNVITTLLDNVHIELPDDFIKRYMLRNNKELRAEEIDEKYESYKKNFLWQLIEKRILEEYKLTVTKDDIEAHIRRFFVKNYFAHFNQEEIQDRLDTLVKDAMKNQEDVRNIYDHLLDNKIKEVFKTEVKMKIKTCDENAFIEEINSEKSNEETAKKRAPKKAKAKKSTSETESVTPTDIASAEAKVEAKSEPETKAKPATKRSKPAAKPEDN